MTLALLLGFLAAAATSALATLALIPMLRRAQVVDIPVGRSLHAAPTPRGGGLAVVLAAVLVMGVAPLIAWHRVGLTDLSARFSTVMLGFVAILAFAVVGLVEDLFALSTQSRLCLQLGLGLFLGLAAAAQAGASPWVAVPVAVCTTGVVNATNFMDGANGLAAGHAVVCALWFVVVSVMHPVPGLGFVMITVAGAAAGFLPFNAPRARLFLGDTGSYALGGAWAFAATVCLASGAPVSAAVAPLLVLVTDAGFTLWMRVRTGQRWYEPHKLHVYQRLVTFGWPHWGVALLVASTAALCSTLAWAGLVLNRQSLAWGLISVVLIAYLYLPLAVGAGDPFRTLRPVR
ncbi:UDP-N-acetylmuramyl pentapeptide phosphotransferase/UDP-N-acetylglucosamine-1-phosphate transferase [Actinomyces ruminicola]|uniref:UDP-N-acetylmuramyl pentapeptide phosphotransferase/UDP-N-acetylglucosamine-1-phosphate transferase n=1 Tax=Actinomyces ruminicola TaxID=332524 RepID=A0A1G9ZN52_9ACTO|nr:glycosyl transferase family 4 [Actinomyces ruminicola]SDN22096.1 UDP-N-acetylmuramyl pentapeptide phosphotransferase/UDP-N-acetylglucosamine-1-phosphate transferase [Actinomyces ruminicola]